MRAFFALSLEKRGKVAICRARGNRGYAAVRALRRETGAPPDLMVEFYVGDDRADDHPYVRADYFNQGSNEWPESQPRFRPAMEAYFAAMTGLSTKLMRNGAPAQPAHRAFSGFCPESLSIPPL